PNERKADPAFDVARKPVVLLWAFVGKDPVKLADFVYDKLLGKDEAAFPKTVNLVAGLTQVLRAEEGEMMPAIVSRILDERNHPRAGSESATSSGDFEREFSPYATYLDTNGLPSSDFLLESFHA